MPEIPTTAKRAIFYKTGGPVTVEDYQVPQQKDLKPGEALVKLEYTGVCHTDLHALLGDWPLENKLPYVIVVRYTDTGRRADRSLSTWNRLCGGHEGAGTIVAIADNTETPLKIGDHVGMKW